MADPINVDGIRRMMGEQAADMTDDDIRRALALLACDYDPDGMPEDVGAQARRFAAAVADAVAPLPSP